MTKKEVIEQVKYWADQAYRGNLHTPYTVHKPGGRKERFYQLCWYDAMERVLELLDKLEEAE